MCVITIDKEITTNIIIIDKLSKKISLNKLSKKSDQNLYQTKEKEKEWLNQIYQKSKLSDDI